MSQDPNNTDEDTRKFRELTGGIDVNEANSSLAGQRIHLGSRAYTLEQYQRMIQPIFLDYRLAYFRFCRREHVSPHYLLYPAMSQVTNLRALDELYLKFNEWKDQFMEALEGNYFFISSVVIGYAQWWNRILREYDAIDPNAPRPSYII